MADIAVYYNSTTGQFAGHFQQQQFNAGNRSYALQVADDVPPGCLYLMPASYDQQGRLMPYPAGEVPMAVVKPFTPPTPRDEV